MQVGYTNLLYKGEVLIKGRNLEVISLSVTFKVLRLRKKEKEF